VSTIAYYGIIYLVPHKQFSDWRVMMRLKKSESKNSTSLYIIKSIYEDGKRTSKIVEKLGTVDQIKKDHPECDPYE